MESTLHPKFDRLMKGDFDVCVMVLEQTKSPLMITNNSKITNVGNEYLKVVAESGAPMARTQEEANIPHTVESWLPIKDIFAIDYYTKDKIVKSPGIFVGMNAIKE